MLTRVAARPAKQHDRLTPKGSVAVLFGSQSGVVEVLHSFMWFDSAFMISNHCL
jgi:hypothetical protein